MHLRSFFLFRNQWCSRQLETRELVCHLLLIYWHFVPPEDVVSHVPTRIQMDNEPQGPLLHTSLCAEHDRLRSHYQNALEVWANLRQDVWQRTWRGKELSGELNRRQGEFARAYAALHKHTRECPACRMGAGMTSSDSDPFWRQSCHSRPE